MISHFSRFQVAPAELESTLLECPFVADAAVYHLPLRCVAPSSHPFQVIGVWQEDQATELPRGYVVLSAEGKKQKDPSAAVRAWVDSRVASHKKLRGGVRVVESVPKSPSGKLLRRSAFTFAPLPVARHSRSLAHAVLREEAKLEPQTITPARAKL